MRTSPCGRLFTLAEIMFCFLTDCLGCYEKVSIRGKGSSYFVSLGLLLSARAETREVGFALSWGTWVDFERWSWDC